MMKRIRKLENNYVMSISVLRQLFDSHNQLLDDGVKHYWQQFNSQICLFDCHDLPLKPLSDTAKPKAGPADCFCMPPPPHHFQQNMQDICHANKWGCTFNIDNKSSLIHRYQACDVLLCYQACTSQIFNIKYTYHKLLIVFHC